MKKKIGIIGFGNMGSAIGGRIKDKYQVYVFDKDKNKTKDLVGIRVAQGCVDLVNKVDTVILAIKPQDFDIVLSGIKNVVKNKLVISIAAGITTGYIEKILNCARVIRAMPNLPARFGVGVSCICQGKLATEKNLNSAARLFSYLGKIFIFNEEMMNAATAISGSGPGFFYDLIENKPKDEWGDFGRNVFIPQFSSAAEKLGFSRKNAKILVEATTRGSLVTAEMTKMAPAELKKQIISRGGTTEAGLEALDKTGSLIAAAKAALKRAKELSREE